MPQNWDLDPSNGDYVMEGGSPKETDSLKIPAYIRLKVKRGQWLYAPNSEYGSDFFTVTKRPSDNANKRLENIGVTALQPLIEDGRANEVEVNVDQNTRNGVGMTTTIEDASGEVVTETFEGLGS